MPVETLHLPFLTSWAACQRNGGHRIGFINGAFDLLHPGHLHLLQYVRTRCARVVVALNSDRTIRDRKGPDRPNQPIATRLMAVRAAYHIDVSLEFEAINPIQLLAAVRPDLYVLGSDYRGQAIPGAEFCRQVEFVDRLPEYSTTALSCFPQAGKLKEERTSNEQL